MGGITYNVSLCDFREVESNCIANEETCTLKISKDITSIPFQRGLFIFGIIALIYSRLKLFDPEISNKASENNKGFRIFSKGLYQVIVDNNLEEVMRNG
jgi:hypothetical protein